MYNESRYFTGFLAKPGWNASEFSGFASAICLRRHHKRFLVTIDATKGLTCIKPFKIVKYDHGCSHQRLVCFSWEITLLAFPELSPFLVDTTRTYSMRTRNANGLSIQKLRPIPTGALLDIST
jgi:hypothetical protein